MRDVGNVPPNDFTARRKGWLNLITYARAKEASDDSHTWEAFEGDMLDGGWEAIAPFAYRLMGGETDASR